MNDQTKKETLWPQRLIIEKLAQSNEGDLFWTCQLELLAQVIDIRAARLILDQCEKYPGLTLRELMDILVTAQVLAKFFYSLDPTAPPPDAG